MRLEISNVHLGESRETTSPRPPVPPASMIAGKLNGGAAARSPVAVSGGGGGETFLQQLVRGEVTVISLAKLVTLVLAACRTRPEGRGRCFVDVGGLTLLSLVHLEREWHLYRGRWISFPLRHRVSERHRSDRNTQLDHLAPEPTQSALNSRTITTCTGRDHAE